MDALIAAAENLNLADDRPVYTAVVVGAAILVIVAFFFPSSYKTGGQRAADPPPGGDFSRPATVAGLCVYPVKSCAGVRVASAEVRRGGLHAGRLCVDRAWVIVRRCSDAARREAEQTCAGGDATCLFGHDGDTLWEPLTIRTFPKMVLLQPSFGGPDLQGELTLTAPDGRSATAPLRNDGKFLRVVLWASMCEGRDQGDAIGAFLTDVLQSKKPLRLVHMAEGRDALRPLSASAKYGKLARRFDVAHFSDWSVYHVLSQQSVEWINARLPSGVPATDAWTYRPNVLVDAPFAFWEDGAAEWTFGRSDDSGCSGGKLRFGKYCGRCMLPTVSRHTGERSKVMEPLRTLRRYRSQFYPHLATTSKFHGPQAFLGVNANFGGEDDDCDDNNDGSPPRSSWEVQVGDPVRPTRLRKPLAPMLGEKNPWGANYF